MIYTDHIYIGYNNNEHHNNYYVVILILKSVSHIRIPSSTTKEVRDIINYCHSRKKPTHTTHCVRAQAPIKEEKASWNI
jgi:hypothetical protein